MDVPAPAFRVALLGVVLRHLGSQAIERLRVLPGPKDNDEARTHGRPFQADVLDVDLGPKRPSAAQRGRGNVPKLQRELREASALWIDWTDYRHEWTFIPESSLAYLRGPGATGAFEFVA